MDKKEFLDYLVSIGWGSKVVSSTRTNQPNFPNQDSAYYKKGTTFHTQHIKYTIRVPVVENDNTQVDVKINYPGKTASAPPLKDKILVFLTKIFGDPYMQNYGVTFYAPNFGNNNNEKSPYKVKHWGGYINIDFLLPLMGAFGGKGEGLDMAWFLNYVKDIAGLMGISGEKSAKTIDVNHSPKQISDKVKEVLNKGRATTESTKKNKTSEIKNEKTDVTNSSVNQDTFFQQKNRTVSQDALFLRNDTTVDKIEFIVNIHEGKPIKTNSIFYEGENVNVNFYIMPGDTSSSYNKKTYKSGRVEYIEQGSSPKSVEMDGNSKRISYGYRNWKKVSWKK